MPTTPVDNDTEFDASCAENTTGIDVRTEFYRKRRIFQLFLKKAVDGEHLI